MKLTRVKVLIVSGIVAVVGVSGCSVHNDLPFFGDDDSSRSDTNKDIVPDSEIDSHTKYLDLPAELPKLAIPDSREAAVKQLSEFGEVEQGWWPDGSWSVWLNGDLKKTDKVNSCLFWKQNGTPGSPAVLAQLYRSNPNFKETLGRALDSPTNRDYRPFDKNKPCLGAVDWSGASPFLSPSNPRIDVVKDWNDTLGELSVKARAAAFAPPNGMSTLDRIRKVLPADSRVEPVDSPAGTIYKVFPSGVPAPAKVTIEQLPVDSPAWNEPEASLRGRVSSWYYNSTVGTSWQATAEKPRPFYQLYPNIGFVVSSTRDYPSQVVINAAGKENGASQPQPDPRGPLPGN